MATTVLEGRLDPTDEHDARDHELVLAARAGDERAFEELLGRHEARVLRVLRLLGVPHDDREDVAQEIFVRVFRHLPGFRPGHAFSGWIYRISVNAVHDYRRQRARRREDPTPSESFEAAPDRGLDPEDAAVGSARRRRLEQALAGLGERARAVFVLCELEGLSTRDVGRALGITSITVRRHLGRARERLHRELARENSKKTRSD